MLSDLGCRLRGCIPAPTAFLTSDPNASGSSLRLQGTEHCRASMKRRACRVTGPGPSGSRIVPDIWRCSCKRRFPRRAPLVIPSGKVGQVTSPPPLPSMPPTILTARGNPRIRLRFGSSAWTRDARLSCPSLSSLRPVAPEMVTLNHSFASWDHSKSCLLQPTPEYAESRACRRCWR